jgi:hypothetical protein
MGELMPTTSVLIIVYFLGLLSGCVFMYLIGVYVKAQFEAEAERRNQAQLKKQISIKNVELDPGRVLEVGFEEALRERARRIAILN